MHRTAVVALLHFCILPSALAAGCSQHYAGGRAPVIVRESLRARTQELCFRAFAVMHSGVSRTPLWAAEHLLRSEVKAARELVRRDTFHEESRLRPADRARLDDYLRSGYDRGHLAPNGDMHDVRAQGESFSLANIVPQVHANNAGVWAGIESAVRTMAVRDGEVYVVTGPAFVGARIARLRKRVLVPTHLWKVVYSPKRQQAGAYLVTNDDTRSYSSMSVAELSRLTGIDPLPGVPQRVREQRAMALPQAQAPAARPADKAGAGSREGPTWRERMRHALDALVRKLMK